MQDNNTTLPNNESPRSLKIFLCHASNDKPIVRELNQRLITDNFDSWLDEHELLPGQDWNFEILKAVRAADVVIVCLSTRSINKAGYVQKEIKYALDIADEQPEGAIFLIPLKLEECEIPERLHRWQWLNYFEASSYQRLVKALYFRANALGLGTSEKANAQLPKKISVASKQKVIHPSRLLYPQEPDDVVQNLVSQIQNGSNLVVAYRCPFKQNPINGKTIRTTTFYDELATAAISKGIIVIDFDNDRLSSNRVYIPSYNLLGIAADMPQFSASRRKLKYGVEAYRSPFVNASKPIRKNNPWREDNGGAKFFAEIVKTLASPVLVILRNIHWEIDSEKHGPSFPEPSYVYADEIPEFGSSMSVVFDIWHEDHWSHIAELIDYAVDELDGTRKLISVP